MEKRLFGTSAECNYGCSALVPFTNISLLGTTNDEGDDCTLNASLVKKPQKLWQLGKNRTQSYHALISPHRISYKNNSFSTKKKHLNVTFLIVRRILWFKNCIQASFVFALTRSLAQVILGQNMQKFSVFFCIIPFYGTKFYKVFVFLQRRIFTNMKSNWDKYLLKQMWRGIGRE